jgi:hypothetical protein
LSEPLAAVIVVAAGLVAAITLWRAWDTRAGALRAGLIVVGWVVAACAIWLAAGPFGAARGPFIALTLLALGPWLLLARPVQRREARNKAAREVALEPSDRQSRAWRGWLRALLAGPLGGIAAMGVGLAWATFAPGDQQTRIVIGGLFVPILWAGGMAWTLSDDRIVRATAVLAGIAILTFTASALRGFA